MIDSDHFKEKDALGHVAERQAQGIASRAENHAHEMAGHLSAGADALRDTALFGALLSLMLFTLEVPFDKACVLLATMLTGWGVWKMARSGWLGWARLERLHRVVREEKWEIEHHRQQEREELAVLYRAKGFTGQLLEEVLDVLMADGDRLLRIMVQEELGLTLESHEHPLKQVLGSFVGAFIASAMICTAFFVGSHALVIIAAALAFALGATLGAYLEGNKLLPALVWNGALFILPVSTTYFLLALGNG